MGVDVDLNPGDPIVAPGTSRVLGIMPNWYAGQPYVALQLLDGPMKGHNYYVAEQITPDVSVGQVVQQGQPIGHYAASGTGIEMGWAGSNWEQTLAQATVGQQRRASDTPAGMSFRNFLDSLGHGGPPMPGPPELRARVRDDRGPAPRCRGAPARTIARTGRPTRRRGRPRPATARGGPAAQPPPMRRDSDASTHGAGQHRARSPSIEPRRRGPVRVTPSSSSRRCSRARTRRCTDRLRPVAAPPADAGDARRRHRARRGCRATQRASSRAPAGVLDQAPAPAPTGGSISVSSSLLTSGQAKFAGRLAELTGLDPRVVAAWELAEESGSAAQGREAASNFNWLNIGYFDSGAGKIAFDKTFSDPISAAEQSAKFLKGEWGGASPSIRAILNSVGHSPDEQMAAIANSDWASSHYGGGANLHGTYDELSDIHIEKNAIA